MDGGIRRLHDMSFSIWLGSGFRATFWGRRTLCVFSKSTGLPIHLSIVFPYLKNPSCFVISIDPPVVSRAVLFLCFAVSGSLLVATCGMYPLLAVFSSPARAPALSRGYMPGVLPGVLASRFLQTILTNQRMIVGFNSFGGLPANLGTFKPGRPPQNLWEERKL